MSINILQYIERQDGLHLVSSQIALQGLKCIAWVGNTRDCDFKILLI